MVIVVGGGVIGACAAYYLARRGLRVTLVERGEIAAGSWRGPLHGIPRGAKDLLAARGYPTSWGAGPFRDQVLPEDATVVSRLAAAGAVLVAKLTLGELAWGDVWFGGMTRNPWKTEQGSSGSSAGPAAAVAAGAVGFAISFTVCAVFPKFGVGEYVGDPDLSLSVAALTSAILGLTGLVAGYFPARDASRLDPVVAMKL